ncbi:MAG: transposase, partial [Puniceicoccaceae bacterium]
VLLRCKVRYLTEGKVLGSPAFVARYLEREKALRKNPARPKPMKGADWGGMTVGKSCRADVFQ